MSYMIRSSLAELGPQQGLAPRELALHGVDRDAPDARQLPVGEPVDVAQGQQHPRLARYLLEGPVEIQIGRGRIVIARPRRELPRYRSLVVGGPGGPPAQLVDADIGQDAIEPRGDRPPGVVAGGGREALKEGALDSVLALGCRRLSTLRLQTIARSQACEGAKSSRRACSSRRGTS